jgi:hypothetical protein
MKYKLTTKAFINIERHIFLNIFAKWLHYIMNL